MGPAAAAPAALLDLSFLTRAERRAIAGVLRRDAQLRRRDEGRVSQLRKSVSDPARLKGLTGDWFRDACARRHQQPLGSELVRASIRRRARGRRGPGAGPARGRPARGALRCPLRPPAAGKALEAIGEPCAELREDEDSAAETEDSLSREEVLVAAEVPDVPAPPGSLLSASSSVSSLSSSTRSSSLASLCGAAELARAAARGRVQLALRYEAAARELRVHVLRCRALAPGPRRRARPYIKTYLLPDASGQGKRKTAVRERGPEPVFNETLTYELEETELQGRSLNLSVWHHDSLGRNLFLGEVEIALGTWDWDNTRPEWFELQPRAPPSPKDLARHGHLNLALRFIPAGSEGAGLPPTGELHIWVKDAQGLEAPRRGTVDAFVQCYVLPDDSKASRQQTRVVRRSRRPLFNHTMVYDGFEAQDLAEACAELTLWHREAFAKRPLGGVRLSLGTGSSYGLRVPWMDSTAEERAAWGRVLARPGRWVEALLPLRPDLAPRA
ncbi:synaptotagmin-like protein 1 [Eudromia elegans]